MAKNKRTVELGTNKIVRDEPIIQNHIHWPKKVGERLKGNKAPIKGSQHARSSFLCWRWTLGLVATLVSTRSKVSVWWHSHPAQNYESHFWLALPYGYTANNARANQGNKEECGTRKKDFWHLRHVASLSFAISCSLVLLVSFSSHPFFLMPLSLDISVSFHLLLLASISFSFFLFSSLFLGISFLWHPLLLTPFSCHHFFMSLCIETFSILFLFTWEQAEADER